MFFSCTEAGVKWSNIHKPVTVDDDLSFLHVMVVMCVTSLIFVLVTWYVDAINPGGFGSSQPYYFPFTVNNYIILAIYSI